MSVCVIRPLVLLLSLLLACCQAQQLSDETQFSCLGRELGYYADTANSCRGYYRCVWPRRTFRFNCPTGTSFSQQLLVCDFTRRVNCSSQQQQTRQTARSSSGRFLSISARRDGDLSDLTPSASVNSDHHHQRHVAPSAGPGNLTAGRRATVLNAQLSPPAERAVGGEERATEKGSLSHTQLRHRTLSSALLDVDTELDVPALKTDVQTKTTQSRHHDEVKLPSLQLQPPRVDSRDEKDDRERHSAEQLLNVARVEFKHKSSVRGGDGELGRGSEETGVFFSPARWLGDWRPMRRSSSSARRTPAVSSSSSSPSAAARQEHARCWRCLKSLVVSWKTCVPCVTPLR